MASSWELQPPYWSESAAHWVVSIERGGRTRWVRDFHSRYDAESFVSRKRGSFTLTLPTEHERRLTHA